MGEQDSFRVESASGTIGKKLEDSRGWVLANGEYHDLWQVGTDTSV
ncbi:hypothetical protein [Siminovitchia fordii]|nr:hypothetical protein [Siminovitchia fordii]